MAVHLEEEERGGPALKWGIVCIQAGAVMPRARAFSVKVLPVVPQTVLFPDGGVAAAP